MADRAILLALSAGAGVLVAAAGFLISSRFKSLLHKKPKMKLFNNHLLLSTRCTWMIKEMGVETDLELIDESLPLKCASSGFKVQRTADLLGHEEPSLSAFADPYKCPLAVPNAKPVPVGDDITDYDLLNDAVPALVVNDEFTMIEGAAICMYLADMYKKLLPEPENKAEYYRWIVYTASTFDNIVRILQHQLVNTPLIDQNPETLQAAFRGFHSFSRALEQVLETNDFICGNTFTAADCVVGFTLYWAYTIQQGTLLSAYPCLLTYLERLRARPAFTATFGTDETWDWDEMVPSYLRAAHSTRISLTR